MEISDLFKFQVIDRKQYDQRRTLVGFIRQQEKRLAVRLLIWQYQRMNITVPAMEELEQQAARLVEDAHRIARERGRNVISILKEMIGDLKQKK
jgi:hypothetical protein